MSRQKNETINDRSISVVLPCYNEESAVIPVLNRITAASRVCSTAGLRIEEVLVVDDGSQDKTVALIENWVQESSSVPLFSVRVISHSARRGYGAAIKTGIAQASGTYIAFYDIDGTYDPICFPELIQKMEEANADMVCGDRLSGCLHMPLTREIGNRIFVATINLLYRTKVVDSCTGMRIFPNTMKQFFSSESLPNGLDYSLAMTLSFLRTGHQMVEVPIHYAKRVGKSKLRVATDGPKFFMRIFISWIYTPKSLRQAVKPTKKSVKYSSQVTDL